METKIDLTPSLKRPLDPTQLNRDVTALNNLVRELNNPLVTGAEVPPGEDLRARAVPVEAPPAPVSRDLSRVFFTGRLAVGKDFVAAATGATIFGFASPIYHLLNFLTNLGVTATSGKDTHGVRATMQTIGQWGRGTTSDAYPVTPARIVFNMMVRSLAKNIDPENKQCVKWSEFGSNPNLWLDALAARVAAHQAENPAARIAVTNVRFKNEYDFLIGQHWVHYHVTASPNTWAQRLAKQKLTPESPALKDVSEQLANTMDASVVKRISQEPRGDKLRVIWNDDTVRVPSPRLLTVAEFLQSASVPAQTAPVNTGE